MMSPHVSAYRELSSPQDVSEFQIAWLISIYVLLYVIYCFFDVLEFDHYRFA